MPFHPSLKQPSGFSLVEVVLAVALASSTLLALVTLMAHGLDVVREAGGTTISSQIIRSVATGLQQTSWALGPDDQPVLPPSANRDHRYFDAQGMETGSAGSPATIYEAQVDWLPNGVTLPGGELNPFTRRVLIQVRPVSQKQISGNRRATSMSVAVTSILPEL